MKVGYGGVGWDGYAKLFLEHQICPSVMFLRIRRSFSVYLTCVVEYSYETSERFKSDVRMMRSSDGLQGDI